MRKPSWCAAALLLTLALMGCSSSPLSEQGIAQQSNELSGRVELSDGSPPADVYVWLEGSTVSTRTTATGEFSLHLPAAQSLLIAGWHRLYFYLANYKLNWVEVLINNGRFVKGAGGVNARGELLDRVSLFKILEITTIVSPAVVPNVFEGPVDVQVSLQATLDSVTVVYPKSVGGLLGAIVLQRQEDGRVFADVPDVSARTRDYDRIGREVRSRRMVFNFTPNIVPPGHYEVIPYFFIEQENMPAGLLASLGEHVEEIGAEFLKIPAKRVGGRFVVTEGGAGRR
ncbi:MAG: carboxypeptidase-like regulatory domain-containing protein [candidate division KSB1 bacterium]|nr:carboxypeptidase-like regulatory domain-containing protein [candidate division KSB1 bacterium]MDZ7272574.1 carboxypeptidase-like regulatory domain-containing protein [candidate division KSB1 bacterium]MDZ7284403.1 carboxypeptidase-like regulatory domain-containing protein [candidate division KSB1 bacterium]MDZ7297201.1 carboxypeptidase-like regulatory domain-containing protein [candidate division KSB1 bacterium]MDZ7308090.1 carboxypeptidase-like regulatory domain-containing protein [candidat